MADIKCDYCDGTDFYKEAGFYFCAECQTQSQVLQEQEFVNTQGDETIVVVHKTKRIKSLASKDSHCEQITSWECYNYILLGLVNELIELGAKENLKEIVQTIWFQYLRKIEVLHQTASKPPNLPAFNNKYDAKIIFGRKDVKKVYKRKRKPSNSSGGSVSGSESTISRREQNRLNRLMAKAAYETSQQTMSQNSDSSLMNISLGSLKSNKSEKQKDGHLNFSRDAKRELASHMTKFHLKEHVEDTEDALECHDLSYRKVSTTYKEGPTIMTQTKLYAILYIALLINKDDIHLGDMLRFMCEGSLSYNYYHHFFPEEIDDQTKFINSFIVAKVFKHETYRIAAGKLTNYLELAEDIPIPNFVNLLKRYCKELNLPHELCECCLNLIQEFPFKLKMRNAIPNYEARAMCAIIFVMKMLFGVDGVTELKFSSFAEQINLSTGKNMFNFDQWIKSVCYRRVVLARHHFPTQFTEKRFNCQEYLDFINAHHAKYDLQRREDMEYDLISRLIFKGNDYQGDSSTKIDFFPSLTPLYDNLKILYENGKLAQENYQLDSLLVNFHEASLDFLSHSQHFLPLGTSLVNSGANTNLKIVPIYSSRAQKQEKRMISCHVSHQQSSVPKIHYDQIDADLLVSTFDSYHSHKFWLCEKYTMNKSEADLEVANNIDYPVHYHPERKFWLRLGSDINNLRSHEFDELYKSLPNTFRLIINECANIINQSRKELLVEYNYFETHLCFNNFAEEENSKRRKMRRKSGIIGDAMLSRLINNSKLYW